MPTETSPTAARSSSWHGLVLFLLIIGCSYLPTARVWPLLWMIPLTLYAAIVLIVPALRDSFPLPRVGRLTHGTAIATAVITVPTSLVLIGFQLAVHPDSSTLLPFLRFPQTYGPIAGGVLFSCLNALLEEFIFRGILFDAVQADWGPRTAVIATAILFGFGHMHGYPPGVAGAILAGIYGVALGMLRTFSGGIGLTTLAHVFADATIYTILLKAN